MSWEDTLGLDIVIIGMHLFISLLERLDKTVLQILFSEIYNVNLHTKILPLLVNFTRYSAKVNYFPNLLYTDVGFSIISLYSSKLILLISNAWIGLNRYRKSRTQYKFNKGLTQYSRMEKD